MNPTLNRMRLTIFESLPFVSLLFILSGPIMANSDNITERISRTDLKPVQGGMPGEKEFKRNVALAADLKMPAVIEVTAKGNGTLRMGNLNLKVVDSYNDGVYYEDEMLRIEFPDIDRDGHREIVISGIVCFSDEKSDKVLRRESVVFIYALQSDQTFKQMYRNTTFRLD